MLCVQNVAARVVVMVMGLEGYFSDSLLRKKNFTPDFPLGADESGTMKVWRMQPLQISGPVGW